MTFEYTASSSCSSVSDAAPAMASIMLERSAASASMVRGYVGQGVFLNLIYVGLYAVGERQDKGYADDAYAAGEGREQVRAFLVLRLLKERDRAVAKDMPGLFLAFVLTGRLHALGVERGRCRP